MLEIQTMLFWYFVLVSEFGSSRHPWGGQSINLTWVFIETLRALRSCAYPEWAHAFGALSVWTDNNTLPATHSRARGLAIVQLPISYFTSISSKANNALFNSNLQLRDSYQCRLQLQLRDSYQCWFHQVCWPQWRSFLLPQHETRSSSYCRSILFGLLLWDPSHLTNPAHCFLLRRSSW